jgi:hypothetical protein
MKNIQKFLNKMIKIFSGDKFLEMNVDECLKYSYFKGLLNFRTDENKFDPIEVTDYQLEFISKVLDCTLDIISTDIWDEACDFLGYNIAYQMYPKEYLDIDNSKLIKLPESLEINQSNNFSIKPNSRDNYTIEFDKLLF